jgi:hypothetical protein
VSGEVRLQILCYLDPSEDFEELLVGESSMVGLLRSLLTSGLWIARAMVWFFYMLSLYLYAA